MNELALFAGAGGVFSVERYLAGIRSARLNLSDTRERFCCNVSETASSHHSPSGMTFALLTENHGGDSLMLSAGDSPAKIYQLPEREPELKASAADCGPRCTESFARFDRDSRSWKTPQCSLLEGLDEYSETWPKAGTMRRGWCWELTMWEPRMSAKRIWILAHGADSDRVSCSQCESEHEGAERAAGGCANQLEAGGDVAYSDSIGRHERAIRDQGECKGAFMASDRRGEEERTRAFFNDSCLGREAKSVETGDSCQTLEEEAREQFSGASGSQVSPWRAEPDVGGSFNGLADKLDNNKHLSDEAKEHGKKILRNLWKGTFPQKIREAFRGFPSISEEEILLALLCQYNEESNSIRIQVESGTAPQAELRNLWRVIEAARTSHQWEHRGQFTREYSDALRIVSHQAPSLYTEAWLNGSWESGISRVADGVASRVDRLKAIGNGQVPLVAASAFRILKQELNKHLK